MLYDLLGFSAGQFPAGLGWHDKIVKGFPQRSLWCLARALTVEASDLAQLVGFPAENLNWRERGALLNSAVSDRLFRLARAYQRLVVPLKSQEDACAWLRTAQAGLGNQVPALLLMTYAGAQETFDAIAAIKPVKSVEMNPVIEASPEDEDTSNALVNADGDPVEIS